MTEYEYHPVCLAFSEYTPDVYAKRLADYRRHPERAGDTAVLIAQDEADGQWKIADGRHHYRICRELGYDCDFQRFTGTPCELADLVESRNANRRHDTPTQIAASIVALNVFRHGGNRKGRDQAAPVPLDPTQAEKAKASGVSERTIRNVVAAAKAEPELLPAMRDGKIDAKTAAKVAKLPKKKREEVAEADDPKAAAKQALREAEPEPEPEPELDEFDDEEDAPPAPDPLDAGQSLEEFAAAASKPADRPPVRRPVNRPAIDPDHPHAELLKAITAFAVKVSQAVNAAEADSKLRAYLLNVGFVFPRAKIVGDRKYKWQCVGLRGLYRVVKLAGLPGKPKAKERILKMYDEANDPANSPENRRAA